METRLAWAVRGRVLSCTHLFRAIVGEAGVKVACPQSMVLLDTDSPGAEPIRVIFISFYVVAKELDLNVSL